MDHANLIVNSFYLVMSGIFVLWMITGLTLFEAGLVRARNTNDILIKNVAALAVGSLVYLLLSYRVMYGSSSSFSNIFPTFHLVSVSDALFHMMTNSAPVYKAEIFYELMLAILSSVIIIGATAERLRLWPYLLFVVFMTGLIYPMCGFWVWGEGFLKQWGFIDRAGASVVHLSAACASLVCVLFLGPRTGKYTASGKSLPLPGANIPLSALGAMLVWIGSYGFNGGSIIDSLNMDAGNVMVVTFLNTTIAASAGTITAMVFSRIVFGTVDLTLVLNGAIAGLISLSASPHLLTAAQTVGLAMTATLAMMLVMYIMDRLQLDDPVGAIAVHGVSAIVSLIGISFLKIGADWKVQLTGTLIIMAWTLVTSFIVWALIRLFMGLRIKPEDEYKGLDVIGCGMVAYPEFTSSGWEK